MADYLALLAVAVLGCSPRPGGWSGAEITVVIFIGWQLLVAARGEWNARRLKRLEGRVDSLGK